MASTPSTTKSKQSKPPKPVVISLSNPNALANKKKQILPKNSKYVKLEPREHVLVRPNMYIGNITEEVLETYVFDIDECAIVKRPIKYIAGLYKIYDEIIVNAIDHIVRLTEEQAKQENIEVAKPIKIPQTKMICINIYRDKKIVELNDDDGDGDDDDDDDDDKSGSDTASDIDSDLNDPLPSPLSNSSIVPSAKSTRSKGSRGSYKSGGTSVTGSVRNLKSKATAIKLSENGRDDDEGYIEIMNDGHGIDVYMDPTHKIYTPEMILGNMLSSSNFDDSEERVIGGQNGIGAKASSVFSKFFSVETVDSIRKIRYYQEFSNNMSKKSKPILEHKYKKKAFTRIRFKPDYERFGCKDLSDDMYSLMLKRAYDVCALTPPDVKVFLNGTQLQVKDFDSYTKLYLAKSAKEQVRYYTKLCSSKCETCQEICIDKTESRVSRCKKCQGTCDKCLGRWEIVLAESPPDTGFDQISFVNGIWTIRGGKHVEYIVNQVTKKFLDMAKSRKRKGIENVKSQYIKENIHVFIKAVISNPNFDSQSKENLVTPMAKFGSRFDIPEKAIEKLYKSSILDRLLSLNDADVDKLAKKTDGKKDLHIHVQKLSDAKIAGSKRSNEAILILTEGDSAKTMAITGLSALDKDERDKYGVFPLKGKLLNVNDVSTSKIHANEEISNIKKIMGLESGKEYTNTDDLRYGHIMVLCDADVDGFHIKGLLFNVFGALWKTLIKQDAFFKTMLTPMIKVWKKSGKKKIQIKDFYNFTDFENWLESNNNGKGWESKYYKGLGTSSDPESKEYFRNPKIIDYVWTDSDCTESLDLAFNKKKANNRKTWIEAYDRNVVPDYTSETMSFKDFINKELIHFSVYNIERSIPSLCDGLKKSTRKILFACFKRNLKKEVKVAQLSGYVSEQAAYHHGEMSVQEAIIGMARNFIGSNNINVLCPNGQFGSRLSGGDDHASPRYIFTQLCNITSKIYRKEDLFGDIIEYLEDDGQSIEPRYYLPIIPMVLVNGALGIGTGYSTDIPCFNPKEIITYLKRMLEGKEVIDKIVLEPYYRGFDGKIIEDTSNPSRKKYISHGIWEQMGESRIEIRELPIGVWTSDYKEFLENYRQKNPKVLKIINDNCSNTKVNFVLDFGYRTLTKELLGKFETEFKLTSPRGLSLTNMHLFNADGQIKLYKTVDDIMTDFYTNRLAGYSRRKDSMIKHLKDKIKYMNAIVAFIIAVNEKKLDLRNISRVEIEEYLEKHKYPKKGSKDKIKKEEDDDDKDDDKDNKDDVKEKGKDKGNKKDEGNWDYLTHMPVYNLTLEKKKKLVEELKEENEILIEIEEQEIEDMWLDDLEELEHELKLFNKEYEKELLNVEKPTKTKTKAKDKAIGKTAKK
jgi:DNA topoisomerase-2